MIFNELIETVKQMKLKNYSYRMKKTLHLKSCCILFPKDPTLYVADTWLEQTHFLRTTDVRYRQVWLYLICASYISVTQTM